MSFAHSANIALHVIAGLIALAVGFVILAKDKGTPTHRRLGRIFGYFGLLVCLFAASGLVFFRFMPVFAVLTILVSYQLVGGWRAAVRQERGPSALDAGWTLLAAVLGAAVAPLLLDKDAGAPSAVVSSTLGGLVAVLAYDSLRWLFPRRWFAVLWRFEHVYKMLGSLFGMLSALVGNVVRVGQPWSQIAPSVLGTVFLAYFFARLLRDARRQRSRVVRLRK